MSDFISGLEVKRKLGSSSNEAASSKEPRASRESLVPPSYFTPHGAKRDRIQAIHCSLVLPLIAIVQPWKNLDKRLKLEKLSPPLNQHQHQHE
jgi:hypothetical protein